MSFLFKGTGVALVTPFHSNGEVDYEGLKKLLKYTSENGVDYWVVQGTTGESATTSKQEKEQILSFVKDNNPGNLPIMFGVGGNNTREILSTIENTDLEGIDGILSVSPYYNKPSQQGILEHYQKIADSSPVPVVIYNVPGRTSSNISAETTLKLSEHENVIGIKEASGDLVQCMEISANMPEDFHLISGDDMLTVPILSIGGIGVISVLANAFPHYFSKIMKAAFNNTFNDATKTVARLLRINPLMYSESNPVGIKQVLKELNICQNYVRLPLIPASEKLQIEIKGFLPGILER